MSQQTLPASARVKARLAERQGRVTAPAETASPATKEDLEALRSELEILIDQHDELAQAKRFLKRWLGWSLKIPLPVRWFGALLGAVTVVVATFTLEENIEPYTIRLTGQFNDMSGSGQANADRCILSGG